MILYKKPAALKILNIILMRKIAEFYGFNLSFSYARNNKK